MTEDFVLVFDDVVLKQLKKVERNNHLKLMLSKMLDKLELFGPLAGELLDSKLFLYELKNKHPPLRLYYKHNRVTNEIYVLKFEMKTSPEKQERTIYKWKYKFSES
ncbi:hypothetical protein HY483_02945 [Candidatus Woesearchaeota archaeon]|nr:hypothetical protein [Candidatus Woesearchaeota archaeon]